MGHVPPLLLSPVLLLAVSPMIPHTVCPCPPTPSTLQITLNIHLQLFPREVTPPGLSSQPWRPFMTRASQGQLSACPMWLILSRTCTGILETLATASMGRKRKKRRRGTPLEGALPAHSLTAASASQTDESLLLILPLLLLFILLLLTHLILLLPLLHPLLHPLLILLIGTVKLLYMNNTSLLRSQ